MTDQQFDFVVVGGGSAGAVIAARLSEDPTCRVALSRRADRRRPRSSMPAAVPGAAAEPRDRLDVHGRRRRSRPAGSRDGRMMVPRGKMLGGSSGINYMAYVRGHPGDFDAWADGRRHRLELRRRAALLQARARAWRRAATSSSTPTPTTPTGPLGVSVRAPVLRGAQEFVEAAVAAGIPAGDYNGRDRGGPAGVVSLLQTTTRRGQAARAPTTRSSRARSSSGRTSTVISGAQVTRVVLGRRRRPAGGTRASSTAPPTARPRSSAPTRRSCSAPARSVRRTSCCCRASARGPSSRRSASRAGSTRPTSAST